MSGSRDFDDVRSDPQAEYAQAFREIPVKDETAVLVNHPIHYDGTPPPFRNMPLDPGQDTRAVLSELDFSDEEIETLLAQGAVCAPTGR